MAYGTKYIMTFNDYFGNTWTVYLKLKDYTGDSEYVVGSGDPVIFNMPESDWKFKVIKGSAVTLNILSDSNWKYVDDFVDYDKTDWLVQVYKKSDYKEASFKIDNYSVGATTQHPTASIKINEVGSLRESIYQAGGEVSKLYNDIVVSLNSQKFIYAKDIQGYSSGATFQVRDSYYGKAFTDTFTIDTADTLYTIRDNIRDNVRFTSLYGTRNGEGSGDEFPEPRFEISYQADYFDNMPLGNENERYLALYIKGPDGVFYPTDCVDFISYQVLPNDTTLSISSYNKFIKNVELKSTGELISVEAEIADLIANEIDGEVGRFLINGEVKSSVIRADSDGVDTVNLKLIDIIEDADQVGVYTSPTPESGLSVIPRNLDADYTPTSFNAGILREPYFKLEIKRSVVSDFEIFSKKISVDSGDNATSVITRFVELINNNTPLEAFIENNTVYLRTWLENITMSFTENTDSTVTSSDFTTSNIDVLFWQGFLNNDLHSEPHVGAPYFISVTAVDNLGVLKEDKIKASGNISLLDAIKKCLELTNINTVILEQNSLRHLGSNTFASELEQVYIDGYAINNKTGYRVLEDILKVYGLRIYQYYGCWFIEDTFRKKENRANINTWIHSFSDELINEYANSNGGTIGGYTRLGEDLNETNTDIRFINNSAELLFNKKKSAVKVKLNYGNAKDFQLKTRRIVNPSFLNYQTDQNYEFVAGWVYAIKNSSNWVDFPYQVQQVEGYQLDINRGVTVSGTLSETTFITQKIENAYPNSPFIAAELSINMEGRFNNDGSKKIEKGRIIVRCEYLDNTGTVQRMFLKENSDSTEWVTDTEQEMAPLSWQENYYRLPIPDDLSGAIDVFVDIRRRVIPEGSTAQLSYQVKSINMYISAQRGFRGEAVIASENNIEDVSSEQFNDEAIQDVAFGNIETFYNNFATLANQLRSKQDRGELGGSSYPILNEYVDVDGRAKNLQEIYAGRLLKELNNNWVELRSEMLGKFDSRFLLRDVTNFNKFFLLLGMKYNLRKGLASCKFAELPDYDGDIFITVTKYDEDSTGSNVYTSDVGDSTDSNVNDDVSDPISGDDLQTVEEKVNALADEDLNFIKTDNGENIETS